MAHLRLLCGASATCLTSRREITVRSCKRFNPRPYESGDKYAAQTKGLSLGTAPPSIWKPHIFTMPILQDGDLHRGTCRMKKIIEPSPKATAGRSQQPRAFVNKGFTDARSNAQQKSRKASTSPVDNYGENLVKLESDFLILDVKRGRRKLSRLLSGGRKRVRVTITADLTAEWGCDDGVSIEFEGHVVGVTVDSVTPTDACGEAAASLAIFSPRKL